MAFAEGSPVLAGLRRASLDFNDVLEIGLVDDDFFKHVRRDG